MVEQCAYQCAYDVLSVPPEIWAEVFLHARKESVLEGAYDQTRITRRDIPISVSQVCDRFRRIAIDTPPLWTSIVVDFSLSSIPSFTLSMTKSWLDRSKNYPLTLFAYNIHVSEMIAQPEKSECFMNILSHLRRWRDVALEWTDTDTDFWPSVMGRMPSASAPLLESLILRSTVDRRVMKKKQLLPSVILANSPSLKKLVVTLQVTVDPEDEPSLGYDSDIISYWTTSKSYTIPYQQLTRLHLDAHTDDLIPCDKVLEIFQRAPNLVCCFIQGIDGPYLQDIPESSTPFLLKALRHLYLEIQDFYGICSVSQFLRYITAPSLFSLTLVFQSDWSFDVDALEDFFDRSSCELEEFNLSPALSDQDMYASLKAIGPSLRRLHVSCLYGTVDHDNKVMESMTSWDPSSTTPKYQLCPQLEQISISSNHNHTLYSEWETFILHLIFRVVSWRLENPQGGSQTFKSVLIPSRWDKRIPPQLLALRGDPWNLGTLGFNDDLYNSELWKRLAYE